MLQPFLQVRLRKGLDEVVHDPAAEGLAHGIHLAGGADHQDIQFRGHLAQLVHQVQAVDVRQVDVQQHQVRLQASGFGHRLRTGVGHPDDGEPGRALDEPGVDFGHHEVVIDDQDFDHGCVPLGVSPGIRRAVKTAPLSLAHGEVAAAAPADHPGERQAEAAAAAGAGILGGETLPEDLPRCPPGTPGPESRTVTVTPSAVSSTEHLTAALRKPGDGVERVVHQVPDDGGQVAGKLIINALQPGIRVKLQRHPALGGEAGLGDQQGGERRVLDAAGDFVVEPGPVQAWRR